MESLAKDHLDRAAGAHHVARQPDFAIAAAADSPEHLVIRHVGQMLEGIRIGNVSHASFFSHHRHILKAKTTATKRNLLEPDGAQGCIKLSILSPRGTSGGPRGGETNKNAPPPHPLLHPMEEREKSQSLMQPWTALTCRSAGRWRAAVLGIFVLKLISRPVR